MILRLTPAARACGIDRTTLWRWSQSDPRVTRAVFRPGWYDMGKLHAAGLCPHPDTLAGQQAEPVAERRQA